MQRQMEELLLPCIINIENAVYDLPEATFVSIDEDALIEEIVEQFEVAQTHLRTDQVKRDSFPDISERGRYTIIRIIVPLEGDATILPQHPRDEYLFGDASIEAGRLFIRYTTEKGPTDRIEGWIRKDLNTLKGWEDIIVNVVRNHNAAVRAVARDNVLKRRSEQASVAEMFARLEIPLQRSTEEISTVVIPITRRQSPTEKWSETNVRLTPEYILEDAEYEYILTVLSRMVEVMERTPRTFAKLLKNEPNQDALSREEELRDILLVSLNGHYEKGATGETFNGDGKTDIYLPFQEKSVFIAECKHWKGKSVLHDALAQLFGYTTWRDTKCALIFFFGGKNVKKDVLDIIEIEVPKYSGYLRSEAKRAREGEFRYTFEYPEGSGCRKTVTVMVFWIRPVDKGVHPKQEKV